MPLDYERLMGLPPRITRQTYTQRDTILYALSVGVAWMFQIDPDNKPVATTTKPEQPETI